MIIKKYIGIDDEKLKENGFHDIWGFFLAIEEDAKNSYKKIDNISGK